MGMFDGTGSTKRAPAMSDGRRGAATTYLTGLAISSLDPVSPEVAMRVGTKGPNELLQVFVDGDVDVKEGDILVAGSREYPIRSCAEWDWGTSKFLHLVIEDIKT